MADGVELPSQIPTSSSRRTAIDLFLISVLILFMELACIRWFPANVLFLTFFTNTVLLACFLGMSLGCLAASHRRNYLKSTPFLLALAMLAASRVEVMQSQFGQVLDVGQNSAQVVFFGAEYDSGSDVARFVIPVELVCGFFFVMIALSLVGPGQELGQALTRLPNRVKAYSINIFGSVVGIVLFGLASWLELPPGWWFLAIVAVIGYFLLERPFTAWQGMQAFLLAIIILLGFSTTIRRCAATTSRSTGRPTTGSPTTRQ